jgi:uncharacterized membrane protein
MPNQDSQTVIAIFHSSALADVAAKFLKVWEKDHRDVKFGTLTLAHEAESGEIKVRNYTPRFMIMGVETGLTLGLIFGGLLGRFVGLSMSRGMLAGAVIGALAGSLSKQGSDLSPQELEDLQPDLREGKAALVLRLDHGHADEVAEELKKLDGEVR